jgi:hypothetical protein
LQIPMVAAEHSDLRTDAFPRGRILYYLLPAVGVALLAIATYIWWISNYLVADSWALIGAISQPDWNLADLLPFHQVPHRINSTYYYAPVSTAVLWLAYKLGGFSPERYHLLNIAFHTATSLLLYAAALRLTRSRLKATLAGAIFAVHFASTEAVGWFGGYTHPMVGFFGAGALVLYLQFLATRRIAWWVGALVALVAGALTQATALPWFAVVACLDILYSRGTDRWSRILRRLAVLAAIPIAVLPTQLQAFSMGPTGYHQRFGSWVFLNIFYYPISAVIPSLEPTAVGLARDLQLAASDQSAFARLMSMNDAFVLLLASVLSVLVAILLVVKGGRVGRFAVVGFGLSLTPFLLVDGQAYRYLYTPLIFFSLGAANSVVDLYRGLKPSSRWAAWAVLMAVPVFITLSFAESQRQMFWWQQAGLIAHRNLQQLQELQPTFPPEAKVVVGGMPDSIPGTNAEIWRQGFEEALQSIYGNRALDVQAYSKDDVERLFQGELKGAPNTYGFIYEDWQFKLLTP